MKAVYSDSSIKDEYQGTLHIMGNVGKLGI